MKKIIFLFFAITILISHNSYLYSQSGWMAQQSGVNASLNSIHFINSNTGWICGDDGRILRTINGGKNWGLQISNSTRTLKSVFFLNENTGWCAGGLFDPNFISRMIVLRTDNGGTTWTVVYDQPSFTSYFVSIYFTDALHGCVVEQGSTGFVSVGGLWITTNGGYNWMPPQSPVNASNKLMFTDANTGWVLGSYWDDTGHDTAYISKSVNGGNTWSKVYQKSKTSVYSSHFINNISGWVSGNDHENFTDSSIILRTTNAGDDWQEYNFSQDVYLRHIFFTDFNNGWGCSGRIYRTTNSGMNWNLQLDYAGTFYNSIFFADSLTGWVAGTNGAILKTTTGGINSIKLLNEVTPENFSLNQNYPNPFNPTTNINFSIPKSSFVTLKVFNIMGKEIASLVNENLNAGVYNFDFNASGFASGIYYYKLMTDNFSETKKMILLK